MKKNTVKKEEFAKFDSNSFNFKYAWKYTSLQFVFFTGLIMGSLFTIYYFKQIKEHFYLFLFWAFVTFVFGLGSITVTGLKLSLKNKVKKSVIKYENEKVIYDKYLGKEYGCKGIIENHDIYTIHKVDSILEKVDEYVIKGNVQYQTIMDGKLENLGGIHSITIPKAYFNIQRIVNKKKS